MSIYQLMSTKHTNHFLTSLHHIWLSYPIVSSVYLACAGQHFLLKPLSNIYLLSIYKFLNDILFNFVHYLFFSNIFFYFWTISLTPTSVNSNKRL